MYMAPPNAVFRSVQNGATTLFGRPGSGMSCGRKFTSELVPPPMTAYPLETIPTDV